MIDPSRLDLPYYPSQPESELDRKWRLAAENDELYRQFRSSIVNSNMDDLAKNISLLNLETQWLEWALNDLYDRLAITSSQQNPLVQLAQISNTLANKFKKDGKTQGFANLTLGSKHFWLSQFSYSETDENKRYQTYLKDLGSFVTNRNEIIHHLFTPKISTATKSKQIGAVLESVEALIAETEKRDQFLAQYLFNNMGAYWDLGSLNNKSRAKA
jgi:hypothetical protein